MDIQLSVVDLLPNDEDVDERFEFVWIENEEIGSDDDDDGDDELWDLFIDLLTNQVDGRVWD
ncbi:hypothetical protein RchiOBHm_Chr1g0344841 [Rosa chinensis]|uniref:Uncharacterized protein n=1 Tax=Rosa chinensis TaxID=74649 RepID=A0A2P6SEM7_ROSCH|nr:hypothetical protein RchiOBHm_Chr1g0344841 [Rosa chinensis]